MSITLLAALLALAAQAQEIPDPNAIFNRAVDHFFAGRFTESADAFDEVAALRPNAAPQLWQRGIALYYAGRYESCREQFESHRTVNPGDVENARMALSVRRGTRISRGRRSGAAAGRRRPPIAHACHL